MPDDPFLTDRIERSVFDPGVVVDGAWLRDQIARIDPLWGDWHHIAHPLPVAARDALELAWDARG